jgi:uncharacterized phage protein (TIGR02218 family)
MAELQKAFQEHVENGLTTLCRCWLITRKDGVIFGFTDHDCKLEFDGLTFKADSGLSALALDQSTGLSVDNTEALGALSDAAVREEDIESGRFDGADVRAWMVNWADTSMRWLQFRGSIGELRRKGGAFQAELRGLAEALNRPLGRIYQKGCTAVLGEAGCQFDLEKPGYTESLPIEAVEEARVFSWAELDGFEPAWFARGRLTVTSGQASGLWGSIKQDRFENGHRIVELWEPIRGGLAVGDQVKLTAGCDKQLSTCRLKFNNFANYQGFPDLPSEDWVAAFPKKDGSNTGGSRR